MPPSSPSLPPRSILRWILAMYAMVGLTVVVGGITRLTGSGLSMVVWQPLIGIVPPLSHAEWERVFGLYKDTPQYLFVNHWMKLPDFQWIFLWEYLHRVVARSIGIVCLVPGIWFAARGQLRGRWARMVAASFVLGGLQGALGWFMVRSGLQDIPAVSHFRLAAHLSLAFFVGMWLLWIALDLTRPDLIGARWTRRTRQAWALVALIALQVVYGAFMAGTKAGHLFSTFPTMDGQWIGAGSFVLSPWWHNLLDNPAAIHTIHRWLGALVLAAILAFVFSARRSVVDEGGRRALTILACMGLAQFTVGAATVLLRVYLPVASLHQTLAYVLVSAAVLAAHRLRQPMGSDGGSAT